jgi:hypothetical protein
VLKPTMRGRKLRGQGVLNQKGRKTRAACGAVGWTDHCLSGLWGHVLGKIAVQSRMHESDAVQQGSSSGRIHSASF